MKKITGWFILFLLLVFMGRISGQTALAPASQADKPGILYTDENSFGIIIHAHGWGMNYKRGKHVTAKLKRNLDIDWVTMRHPKELKSQNPYSDNSKGYYYGKLNAASVVRAGYGFYHVLYGKELPGAIEVRFHYSLGANIGILKPVYLQIYRQNPSIPDAYEVKTERYDPTKHFTDNIYGKAPFLKGINELGLNPGLYAKAGFCFEYGAEEESVKAIETGMIIDINPKPLAIMAFNTNNPVIVGFYVNILWGRKWYK